MFAKLCEESAIKREKRFRDDIRRARVFLEHQNDSVAEEVDVNQVRVQTRTVGGGRRWSGHIWSIIPCIKRVNRHVGWSTGCDSTLVRGVC